MDEPSIDLGVKAIVEERRQDRAWTLKLSFDPRWLCGALVVLLSACVLRGFLEPLAWAAVIAVATWPIYRRLAQLLRSSTTSSVAALLGTSLVSLFVLAPMAFAFGALAAQARRLVDQLALVDKTGLATPAWLETLPLVGARLSERWQALLGTPGGVSFWLHQADTTAALGWAQVLGQFIAHHLFVIAFAILVLFFIYRGGDALALQLHRLLQDKLGDRAKSYVELATVALRATVNGMVVVSLFDGALAGIIYALAGVHRPDVWGAVTGLFAMVPFLGYVAVAGVSLTLIAKGTLFSALGVGALGFVIVFAGDKILRPMIVGSEAKLGFVWVLLGSLGGLELLGLLGLFVGPVVLALAGAVWREWIKNRVPSSTGGVAAAVLDHT